VRLAAGGAEGLARTGQAGFVAETFAEVLYEVQRRLSVQFESFEDRSTVPRDRSCFVSSKLAAGPVLQATLFVGGSVLEWQESLIRQTVPAMRLDQFIQLEAERAEIKTSVPFLVVIEGEFTDAKLHVINGACPVHARRNKKSLAPEVKPYEEHFASLPGRLVGIFALNAAGKLTHPGTSLHAHLIWKHENGQQFTGHLEQTGVKEGSRMKIARRLAKVSLPAAQSEPSSKFGDYPRSCCSNPVWSMSPERPA
jgi:hypothetical protein